MTWYDWLLLVFFVLCALGFTAAMIEMLRPWQYIPPTYDEEVEWLMRDHNMSREEAEAVADGRPL